MDLICQKFTKLASLYVADALSQRQRESMRAHLDTCERCQQALAEAQQVATSLRCAAPPRAPVGLAAGIKAELRLQVAHRKANAIPARMIGSPAFLAVSSTLVVGAVLTFIVLTQVVMPGIPMDGQPLPTPSGSMIVVVPPDASAPGHTVVVSAPASPAVATAPTTAWHGRDLQVRDIASRNVNSGASKSAPMRAFIARADTRPASRPARAPIASFARDEAATFAAVAEARAPLETAGGQPAKSASVTTLDTIESNRDLAASDDPVTNEVVGALIADLVVDRYVHGELVRNETAMLASAPASRATITPTTGVVRTPTAGATIVPAASSTKDH